MRTLHQSSSHPLQSFHTRMAKHALFISLRFLRPIPFINFVLHDILPLNNMNMSFVIHISSYEIPLNIMYLFEATLGDHIIHHRVCKKGFENRFSKSNPSTIYNWLALQRDNLCWTLSTKKRQPLSLWVFPVRGIPRWRLRDLVSFIPDIWTTWCLYPEEVFLEK